MRQLLYLHGVGDDGSRLDWLDSLDLPRDVLLAPDYLDILTSNRIHEEGHRGYEPDPGAAGRPTRSVPTIADRRRYRHSQVGLHEQLLEFGSDSVLPDSRRGFGRIPRLVDAIGEQIVLGLLYDVVARYNGDHLRRRAIREKVLSGLPSRECELVIVAHSLGGMVAVDLIQHLPDHLSVTLLVTAASNLARNQLPDDIRQLRHRFPYDRVGAWLNVYNPSDVVTRGAPIAGRFPQALDVSVSAPLGDHALIACMRDSGVAHLVRGAVTESGPGPEPTVRPGADTERDAGTASAPGRSLTSVQTAQVLLAQLTMRMEELFAAYPDTTPTDLTRFHEARFLAHERLRKTTPGRLFWDDDHTSILREQVGEQELPALLLRLVRANPLKKLRIDLPEGLVASARARTAMDLGVPPGWLTLASGSLASAAEVAGTPISPAPHSGSDPGLAGDLDPVEHLVANLAGLRSLTVPEQLGSELARIPPAIVELLARALLAEKLNTPGPGSIERSLLSQIMAELGRFRVQPPGPPGLSDGVADELADRVSQLARALDWLAARGIGLQPLTRDPVSAPG